MTEARVRRSPPHIVPLAKYLALVGLTYVLGLAAIAWTDQGTNVAVWWPAAGSAVLAVLAVPRRHYLTASGGLWLMTGLANVLAGRDLPLSVGYGLANATEALVVALILTWGGRRPALATLRDMRLLIVAATAGATLIGLMAGATAALVGGAAFLSTAVAIAMSHGSAMLALIPLAIATTRPRSVTSRWQEVAQPLALAVVVLFVFWPGRHLPIAFLPMPFMVWGALQFATRYVAIELAAVAFAVTSLTAAGGGPFAGTASLEHLQQVEVLQAFLVTYSASVLVFSAARNERLRLSERVAERDQLLRGGILDAQVGLVIMHESRDDRVWIIQSNERAAALLGSGLPVVDAEPDEGGELEVTLTASEDSPLAQAIMSARQAIGGEWSGEFSIGADGEPTIELFITRVPQQFDEALLTVQVVDVSARVNAESAVRRALRDEHRASERLRELNQQQDDFVSTVSHELRTPITSIIGFVEVLIDEESFPPEAESYLRIIERNATRLNLLVEDLLTLGATSSTRADPGASCDMGRLCLQVAEELQPIAVRRGVELTAIPHRQLYVRGEPADLTRVLANLVTNAVKFTPPGGAVSIDVDVDDSGGDCVLTVTDTGSGIPVDALERVFGRFVRGPGADLAAVPGAGLGLALVRELVARSGGTVELRSDGTNGTLAIVRLPLAVPDRR